MCVESDEQAAEFSMIGICSDSASSNTFTIASALRLPVGDEDARHDISQGEATPCNCHLEIG